jgi:hypothetical protein
MLLIGRDFDLNLKQKDIEIQTLRTRLSDLEDVIKREQSSTKAKVDEVNRKKDEELRMLEDRVVQILQIKDKAIEELKQKLNEAQVKATQLELIIEKQRQELLQ